MDDDQTETKIHTMKTFNNDQRNCEYKFNHGRINIQVTFLVVFVGYFRVTEY